MPRQPHALALVPTRELAAQVHDALAPLAASLGLKATTVYGGTPIRPQIRALQRGTDLVVATPGRLTDLIKQGACSLDAVSVTVLDEADHMADMGFLPAVRWLLDRVPEGGQRLLFSATLDRDVDTIVRAYLTDPARHAVAAPTSSPAQLDHQFQTVAASGDKLAAARALIAQRNRVLLFVRTKRGAARLARQLTRAGTPAGELHGDLAQNARQRALASFASGTVPVLVATDIAARGLHVDDIDLVVHYDPPTEAKAYLHRSGRTARSGAAGTVVTLVLPDQAAEVERLRRSAGLAPPRPHRTDRGGRAGRGAADRQAPARRTRAPRRSRRRTAA
jgi:superfamily II DNA/RNA helicase